MSNQTRRETDSELLCQKWKSIGPRFLGRLVKPVKFSFLATKIHLSQSRNRSNSPFLQLKYTYTPTEIYLPICIFKIKQFYEKRHYQITTFFFFCGKSNNKMGINTKTTLYHFQSLIIKALQNNVVKHIHTGTVVARFNRYSISKMFFQIPITFSNQIFCFFFAN